MVAPGLHAPLGTPALTTVRQPMELMGAMAATSIIDEVVAVDKGGRAEAVHQIVDPELVVRESTASPG